MRSKLLGFTATGVITAALVLSTSAYASASPGPLRLRVPVLTKLALIKDNDLAAIGNQFAPSFPWIACGLGTAPPYASKTGKCKADQVPIYASYWAFKSAIADGRLKPGQVVLFDQEGWVYTPKAEQEHPDRYARLIGQLASAAGLYVVFSAAERGEAAELAVDEAAAPYVAAVTVQSQRYDANPAQFRRYINRAVLDLRAASPTVPIIAGLATDAGGVPVSATDMLREYRAAYPLVTGFWVNADQWRGGKGCSPTGCGAVGARFLRLIHAKTAPGKPVKKRHHTTKAST
jgi:hypothetical protein